MNFEIDISSAIQYKSKAQKARVLTENWVQENIVCPGCGTGLMRYTNNSPVADFCCSVCVEDYELKATSGILGKMIPDGAYRTMIMRLEAHTCQVSCDHTPVRSWPFFQARALLQAVIASFKAEQHP